MTYRSDTEYRAFRPAMDADAMRVQRAFLTPEGAHNPDRVVGIAMAIVGVVLVILTTTGAIT